MLQAQHYSEFHRLIWVCGIIGSVGGACGVFYGIAKLVNITYWKACEIFVNILSIKTIQETTIATAKVTADTKSAVDLIQTNHLAHLQDGIIEVARTNTQLVGISGEIRDGIIKLVDRSDRRRSTDVS